MFKRSVAFVLLGVLVMGVAAVAWGTSGGGDLRSSLAALAGQEDEGHERDHDRHDDDDDDDRRGWRDGWRAGGGDDD